jgi:nucleoside-diphosphate-sugar epimerase
MEKIVIVGIGGFTGEHLNQSLVNSYSIVGIGKKKEYKLKSGGIYRSIDDVTIEDVQDATYVIFCHSYKNTTYTEAISGKSISTVKKILDFFDLKNKGSGKLNGIIYFSSLAIYRGYQGGSVDINSPPNFDQTDWYARTKIAEEIVITEFSMNQGVKHLILRASAIVGTNFHGNLISKIYLALKGNHNLIIYNKDIDFNVLVGIGSVVKIVKNFFLNDTLLMNKTFILSSSNSATLELIVDKLRKLLHSKSKIIWGESILRGPHLVVQNEDIFKVNYLQSIEEIIRDI